MDKEAIALVEDVRKALVDFGNTQTRSAKKKTRKITSQIIWEPGPYLDELDNILRTSKSTEQAVLKIRSLVRKSEEHALSIMNLLPDDTMHHIVQSRTGGDALTEVPYSRSGPIIGRLSDKHQMTFGNTFGPGSNLPAEMSLSNYSHKADDKATGLERESGIGVNPDKSSTAHPGSTGKHANMKGVDMSSDTAIEVALDDKVTQQVQAAENALQTDAPRQQALRDLTGNPLLYTGTAEDVAESRISALQLDPEQVRQSYQKLITGDGSIRYNASIPGAEFIQAVTRNPKGALIGAASFIQPEAITSAIQGDTQAAATQTAVGAGIGAAVEQTIKRVAPVASRVLPKQIVSFVGGAAKLVSGPVGWGYAGLEVIDAVTKGVTGKGIWEPTGREITEEELDFSTL